MTEESLLPPDFLQLFLGLLEHTGVHEDHHHQRQVKGDDGRGHGVGRVGVEVAAFMPITYKASSHFYLSTVV